MTTAPIRAPWARRPPAAVGEALAWCAALSYPVALYFAVVAEPELTGLRLLPLVACAALPVALVWRRPLPALVLVLTASFLATTTAASRAAVTTPWAWAPAPVWQLGYLQALVADLVVAWIVATRPGVLRMLLTAGPTFAAQAVGASHYRSGSDAYVSTLAFLALALTVACTVGHLVHERRRHAESDRSRTAELAVSAERLRIARELHDMVAHSIGAIAIQAGVGRRVIDSRPTDARDALTAIESTSRETLAGLRHMLGALRQADPEGPPLAPAPTLADLDRLVAHAQDAGVRVDVVHSGEQRPLSADVELAAFRIVQEALTNVIRHAAVSECRVSVDYGDRALTVTVTDDGRGTAEEPGRGYGLTGMRERATLLRGRCTAGPRPGGGFRVTAWLPVPVGVR
ncbi:sensor histidine kinase [Streptomyces sp. NPDC059578]|uniref:sensor histidine kinase n=1 Tax=Streptomyces sp. NPDC059578 TaxID=3346874 RepID=UPI0036C1E8B6